MDQDELMTARELADRLRCSVAAIRRWTRQGMPGVRMGRRPRRYRAAECERFLAERGKERE
jgi:excisionase family DNA binding protein